MIVQYRHTQIGYMVIIPIGIVLFIIVALFMIIASSIFNRWVE